MSKQETDQARNVPPKPVALTVAETKQVTGGLPDVAPDIGNVIIIVMRPPSGEISWRVRH